MGTANLRVVADNTQKFKNILSSKLRNKFQRISEKNGWKVKRDRTTLTMYILRFRQTKTLMIKRNLAEFIKLFQNAQKGIVKEL